MHILLFPLVSPIQWDLQWICPFDLFLVVKLPSSCFFSFALPLPNGLSLVLQFKLCSAYLLQTLPLGYILIPSILILLGLDHQACWRFWSQFGFCMGFMVSQIYNLFSILGNKVFGDLSSLLFFFLKSLFSVLRVTFGSRKAKHEDYWLPYLSCCYESELANHTRET